MEPSLPRHTHAGRGGSGLASPKATPYNSLDRYFFLFCSLLFSIVCLARPASATLGHGHGVARAPWWGPRRRTGVVLTKSPRPLDIPRHTHSGLCEQPGGAARSTAQHRLPAKVEFAGWVPTPAPSGQARV